MAADAANPPSDIQRQLRQAIGLLASEPARAEALARDILGAAPGDREASTVLGAALRGQGHAEAAVAVLEPLAAQADAPWMAHFELAQALASAGRSRAAIAPLSRAVALNPGLAAGWRLLGDIQLLSGDVTAAQRAYDGLLRAVLPDARLQAPAEALADGRLGEAEGDLRALLARDPSSLAAAHLMGEVLARQGRLADAARLLAEVVRQAPSLNLARQALALALFGANKPLEAVAELDRLLERDPRNNRAQIVRTAALTEIGDYAGAAAVTTALLRAFPDQPHAWLVHGAGLRTLGRIEEAVAAWRRCLELDPARSDAWWSLANLKAYRFQADELAAIDSQLARPDLPAQDRANLEFTLGKAREDDRRHAEAFEHYAQGNRLERARRAYDPDVTSHFVERSKALFSEAFFAERAGWGNSAPDPIFIVGLPRSGSTLVDQILASHPAVEGTRELMEVQVIADGLEASVAYPDGLARLPREAFARLGADYLAWTGVRRARGRPRFTDKAPWNFMHVGLIQLILPNARIVDVRRHPLGCGLSAFKQHFAQGFDFSYDLADIGRYYADYVALMAHFDAVMPGRVHRVIYEQLVADTETEVRRLLAYLGLPFDPACLRFFETSRAVATPSSEQVRQPIFADAVDQWRNFEPWLGPLKAALGPVLDAYPAPP